MDIGKKLKELRLQNDLTLNDLASRSELSKGFLSQVERNLTTPSIATLEDILEALGSNLSDFFHEEEEHQIVFGQEGFQIEWIVPNAQKNQMEPIILTLAPHQKSREVSAFQGEEFGYVLKGKVEIHLGKRSYIAKKGDAFYYKADKTHYLKGIEQTELIWVTSPPSF